MIDFKRLFSRNNRGESPPVLYLASGIPERIREKGRVIVLDPAFSFAGRNVLKDLRGKGDIDLVAKEAIDYLSGDKRAYSKIILDMPHIGIIDSNSDFPRLCRLMHQRLSKSGELDILTDIRPDWEATVHRIPKRSLLQEALRRGASFEDLSEEEKTRFLEDVEELAAANIIKRLEEAGFETKFHIASKKEIERSAGAKARAMRGIVIYRVLAKP